MKSDINIKKLIWDAENRLNQCLGAKITILPNPVILKDTERNLCLRCELHHEDEGKNSSVILKKIVYQPTCGYNDWASLQFIAQTGSPSVQAPRFMLGEVEKEYFLMEDLGAGQSLEDLLNGSCRESVHQYFREFARQMAQLHGLSTGRESEFMQLRQELPGSDYLTRNTQSDRWEKGLFNFFQWFELGGLKIPEAMYESIESIKDSYCNPGPFLSFTHGDVCPGNNLITKDKLYLIDFEYGGYRHALYDMTAWNILCPLPADLLKVIRSEYAQQLNQISRIPISELEFEQEWNYMSAWRALALLSWIPLGAFQEDQPWVFNWSCRQAVLTTIERLHQACSEESELLALGDHVGKLGTRLRRQWGDMGDCLPQWKVFAR